MEYLILMTMAGSVLSLVYWIWDRCFHDFLTPVHEIQGADNNIIGLSGTLGMAEGYLWLRGLLVLAGEGACDHGAPCGDSGYHNERGSL